MGTETEGLEEVTKAVPGSVLPIRRNSYGGTLPTSIRNHGEPIRFENAGPLTGFSATSGRGGEVIRVWTCHALTSDEPSFHRIAHGFAGVIAHLAEQKNLLLRIDQAQTLLFVLKADLSAELWIDTAAVAIRCAAKRSVEAGEAIFERDIADITGMGFPAIEFASTDKVLCIFREGWRFGLAFDFNPNGNLDTARFSRSLGALYRELCYSELYEAMSDTPVSSRLLAEGWFPFVEIISSEFKDLIRHVKAGFDLAEVNQKIVTSFDDERLQKILDRWLRKAHFSARKDLLVAAIEAYKRKDPIAVIKIVLTELEGVLNDAHRAANNGNSAKLKRLLKFSIESAQERAGESNSLFMPLAFAKYLDTHTFANFNPTAQAGDASSRHAIGHGAAKAESYTMVRALQAILTLDQFAFYT